MATPDPTVKTRTRNAEEVVQVSRLPGESMGEFKERATGYIRTHAEKLKHQARFCEIEEVRTRDTILGVIRHRPAAADDPEDPNQLMYRPRAGKVVYEDNILRNSTVTEGVEDFIGGDVIYESTYRDAEDSNCVAVDLDSTECKELEEFMAGLVYLPNAIRSGAFTLNEARELREASLCAAG